jgi:hypothetical protein
VPTCCTWYMCGIKLLPHGIVNSYGDELDLLIRSRLDVEATSGCRE